MKMTKPEHQTGSDKGLLNLVTAISDRIVRLERPLMGILIAGIFLVVLLNLVSRSLGWALYWADELAIYLMIWAAMVGASISIKLKTAISVRLAHDHLPPAALHLIDTLVDVLILLSAVCLLVFSWIWYDPVTLISNGLDVEAFKSSTFNFIYNEPTVTLQIKKFWLWLVMPLVAINMTVHACSNLLQSITGQTLNVMRQV
jgi:TRAP-type C4-dicarboxylate transport system permease small subunit